MSSREVLNNVKQDSFELPTNF